MFVHYDYNIMGESTGYLGGKVNTTITLVRLLPERHNMNKVLDMTWVIRKIQRAPTVT